MSYKTFLRMMFLFLFVVSVLALVTSLFVDKKEEIVTGFIQILKTDSYKHYKDTVINTYAMDLNSFGENYGTSSQPEIAGAAGMLIDLNDGKVLFEKNSAEKRKIASLTKIMTAVVALEHKPLNSKILVSQKAANIGENAMGISEGEIYFLEELLYGLILQSGNDAAYAIAEGVAGDSDRFVQWMNFKAQELGLKNTFFACPSGLDDRTYSTPEDLVKLTQYALKNPEFRRIIKTIDMEVIGNEHKYLFLENQTNLLTTYPGVAGVKTGYTEEAGLCLVTFASNEGHEVVGVVLNSVDRKGDMILMLDHGFSTIGVNVEHHLLD